MKNRRDFIKDIGVGIITVSLVSTAFPITDDWIPVLKSDVVNSVSRVYTDEVVVGIKTQIQNQIDALRCFVVVDDIGDTVLLSKVAGQITDVKYENSVLSIKWKVLDTPMGKVVKDLSMNDKQLNVVICGIGSYTSKSGTKYSNDAHIINNDYEFSHFILTVDPSTYHGLV